MTVARVFMGWDRREVLAYRVAERSLRRRASCPVVVTPLKLERNEHWGLIKRPRELREGRLWDAISEAPMSTEFAISRFLVPMLGQDGWVLFCDCDVVFLEDVAELFALADERFAVMCVKHDYQPAEAVKMDGQAQLAYKRKNWSSVMLFNCGHAGNARLTYTAVNKLPGRNLHGFCWLADHEIGELPPAWNWLVGVQPKPPAPRLAHFTLGGPWFEDWPGAEHDEIWTSEASA